jgi:hypothetical protein
MNRRELVELVERLGWRWTDDALILHTTLRGRTYRVAIPIQQVDTAVGAELQRGGLQWPATVSGDRSSVGFWKKLTRAVKRAARPLAKRIVPKAIQRAAHRLERQAGRVVQQVSRYGQAAIRSPYMTGTLAALSFVPGVQAIAIPALAAQQAAKKALDMLDQGMAAAKLIQQGVQNPRLVAQRLAGQQAFQAFAGVRQQALQGNPQAVQFLAAVNRQVR